MELYGKTWQRRELEARIGRLDQIGGVQRLRGIEGPEREVEQIIVRTGGGLVYTVTPEKGMDIALAEFAGAPIAWMAPNGLPHPAYYDDRGLAWLRSASGGLLMTCGLTQVGSPNNDQGEELGLHGRIHHTPARAVSASTEWEGNQCVVKVSGVVEETIIYGTHLRLRREITSVLGSNRLAITDTVENLGFTPTPFMILYHFNFGFPLLDEATRLIFPSRKLVPNPDIVTPAGVDPLAGYDGWQAPNPHHAAQVYFHQDLATDDQGWAAAVVHQPAFPLPSGPVPLNVRLEWDAAALPHLTQWRMPGAGTHVLGIEPGNCHVRGRAAARADGTLVTLAPGATETIRLRLTLELPAH
jgi:galactose mutarotase-like enzyme